MKSDKIRISVLITAFNRKKLTLECLRCLFEGGADQFEVRVFLVDDGSTDGTADAVKAHFPKVDVIESSGNLYWNRGMKFAWEHAAKFPTDFFLWLNDDTHLLDGALSKLVTDAKKYGPKAIVVGKICDPTSGEIVYGGFQRRFLEKNIFGMTLYLDHFALANPTDEECETMHGNCVLIPEHALIDVGMNDPVFWHSEGDTDYGLRAKRKGYRIFQTTYPVGFGTYNAAYELNRSRLNLTNWKFVLFNPKGRRIPEVFVYYRRHLKTLWFPRFLWSYVRMITG